MDPFGNDSDLKDDVLIKGKKKDSIPIKQLIIIIIILLVTTVSAIILIIYLSNLPNEQNKNKSHYSEIVCKFKIDNSSVEVPILGEEFNLTNKSILSTYINETKINNSKIYKFNTEGIYIIKFILNEEINMDYMFKNIESIETIKMSSNTNDKILSIKSAFENCINLMNISINGFNIEQIKSTSKLFYNTGIKDFKLNIFKKNNIEDMSYMFASTKILE